MVEWNRVGKLTAIFAVVSYLSLLWQSLFPSVIPNEIALWDLLYPIFGGFIAGMLVNVVFEKFVPPPYSAGLYTLIGGIAVMVVFLVVVNLIFWALGDKITPATEVQIEEIKNTIGVFTLIGFVGLLVNSAVVFGLDYLTFAWLGF